MYYSDLIISETQADKILALQLDKSLAGMKDEMLDAAARIQDGATRAIYYTSCFTQNYQNVCAKLKSEDSRFLSGIVQLVRNRRIIYDLIGIYFDEVFKNKTQQQVLAIGMALEKVGVNVSASTLTAKSFVAGLTTTVCLSAGFSPLIVAKVRKLSGGAVFLAGAYGYVQQASESADRLKLLSPMYYHALYMQQLEMMYFLVEPVFTKAGAFAPHYYMSDHDVVNIIQRMVR
ncbi:hypothetical protein AB1287_13510 [Enterobacter asburiae]|uniref:hypothetical protein n=1 Tax=unclassified Scandinavium TaxID=2830652 RepID=UPI0028973CC4|nr:hypothetical protein [Scandinavium sp.]